jgi:hypothetical protein
MAVYHFGPLMRFIPNAVGSVMARIVSGANKLFAQNIPVEYSSDDPDKIGGYNKFWFVGRAAIIHANSVTGVITYQGMSFTLPHSNVLVAHVANDVLYFAALASGNHLHVYGIDLTGAAASTEVQDPSDRISKLFEINSSTGVVTVYYWDQVTGLQGTYTDSVATRGTRSLLIPAFSHAGDEFYYGYSNVSTWVADAFKFTIDTIDWSPETLAILLTNSEYPTNLTKQIALDEIILSTWDGGRTVYGPANEPLPDYNDPGNVGQIIETQNYNIRLPSRNYSAGAHVHATSTGHYWVADNSGTSSSSGTSTGMFFNTFPDDPKTTVSDGTITWTYGGPVDGSPIGAFTYTDPISQEFCPSEPGSSIMQYGKTLETLIDEIIASGGDFGGDEYYTYEFIDGPTSFSDQSYESVPIGYQYELAFGEVYYNPLLTRIAKMKRSHYDSDDNLLGEDFIYPSSSRDLMIYEYENRSGIPTATLYPNGVTGVSGQEPVGWALNPDSNSVEQCYYQEISGTATTVVKTGSRPVNGLYYFWPGFNDINLNADALDDLEANRPALTGGDYSYAVTGHTRIKRGFYIGSELQYEIYSGNENINNSLEFTGSSYSHTPTSSTSTGGTATTSTAGNAVAQNVIGVAISSGNTYIRQKMENLHARAYALVRWAESVWTGADPMRSITQTLLAVSGGEHTVVDAPFLMVSDISASFTSSNVSGNYEENGVAPLNLDGDCLFCLYWHYIGDYPGTSETVSPYINQKLFTSAGDNITSVNFNGTLVDLEDLNSAFPGTGSSPMYLEIIGNQNE